ncbi:FYN-binding protein 2 [Tachyglossus aculeatus]|uniref:FYN-binding protein 2 n=1 Tax=Tachyglossus aculeatus TaxID=9261 RepID=UPI0018F46EA4|nr:FYN-binding protein 2 [Tachyglossus aculeatus]
MAASRTAAPGGDQLSGTAWEAAGNRDPTPHPGGSEAMDGGNRSSRPSAPQRTGLKPRIVLKPTYGHTALCLQRRDSNSGLVGVATFRFMSPGDLETPPAPSSRPDNNPIPCPVVFQEEVRALHFLALRARFQSKATAGPPRETTGHSPPDPSPARMPRELGDPPRMWAQSQDNMDLSPRDATTVVGSGPERRTFSETLRIWEEAAVAAETTHPPPLLPRLARGGISPWRLRGSGPGTTPTIKPAGLTSVGAKTRRIPQPERPHKPRELSSRSQGRAADGSLRPPRWRPLPALESLGPPPPKPLRPLEVTLHRFQHSARTPPSAPRTRSLGLRRSPGCLPNTLAASVTAPNPIPAAEDRSPIDSTYENPEQLDHQDRTASNPRLAGAAPDPRVSGGFVSPINGHRQSPASSTGDDDMYDDVECLTWERLQLTLFLSLSSRGVAGAGDERDEGVGEEESCPQITDQDGGETPRGLGRFFRKDKEKSKTKNVKSRMTLSMFSASLPNLNFRSQEAAAYDDVDKGGPRDLREQEEKLKTKKWKFQGARETERQRPRGPERNLFGMKKQDPEKNRVATKEEKIFRERFEYDKEISVINTAVACAHSCPPDALHLKVEPGEWLDIIDVTESDSVICRNAAGKYGYVLIMHLDFKAPCLAPSSPPTITTASCS